jgi:uncharacterized protein YgbK (DUF1537 family)
MAAGCRHITFDATETVHLDTIAAVADRIQDDVILVGSAGLAARQAARLESSATGPFPPERLQRMLWICGSASALAARQIRALSERTSVVPVDLTAAQLAASTAERVALIDRVTTGWRRGVLLLRIAPGGAGLYDDPRALTGGIAKLAAAAVVRTQPDGIFLTGGDTAAAVWRHLGASAVRLAGEVLPGVIWGTWVGGAMAARPVITKAGAFGAPETLLRLYRRLMAS